MILVLRSIASDAFVALPSIDFILSLRRVTFFDTCTTHCCEGEYLGVSADLFSHGSTCHGKGRLSLEPRHEASFYASLGRPIQVLESADMVVLWLRGYDGQGANLG